MQNGRSLKKNNKTRVKEREGRERRKVGRALPINKVSPDDV